MTPRLAQKLAKVLWGTSALVGIGAITLGLYLGVERLIPGKTTAQSEPIQWSPPRSRKGELPLSSFKPGWEIAIIEDKPVPKPVPKTPRKPPVKRPKKARALNLPLQWIGTMVQSTQEKSCAIVLDKRGGKQILLYQGGEIPGYAYCVIKITVDEIQIGDDQNTCVLKRPKPWQDLMQKHSSPRRRLLHLAMRGKNITVVDSSGYRKYGLKKHDRIVSLEGKRVSDIDETRTAVEGIEKKMMQMAVLRRGKMVALAIPTRAIARLAESPR